MGIIIGENRVVTVPAELKNIGVQFDNNATKIEFTCPRYANDVDMSKLSIQINFIRADRVSGVYIADDVTIDPDNSNLMHFTWTLTTFATSVKGKLSFLVCIRDVDINAVETFHWNSNISKDLNITEGLEADPLIEQDYPDILMWILSRLTSGVANGANGFDPIVSFQRVATGTELSITDKYGVHTVILPDGPAADMAILSSLPEAINNVSTLENGTSYYLGEQTYMQIGYPTTANAGDAILVDFSAGEDCVFLIYGSNICGDTVVDVTEGRHYQILAEFNGSKWFIQHLSYTE